MPAQDHPESCHADHEVVHFNVASLLKVLENPHDLSPDCLLEIDLGNHAVGLRGGKLDVVWPRQFGSWHEEALAAHHTPTFWNGAQPPRTRVLQHRVGLEEPFHGFGPKPVGTH